MLRSDCKILVACCTNYIFTQCRRFLEVGHVGSVSSHDPITNVTHDNRLCTGVEGTIGKVQKQKRSNNMSTVKRVDFFSNIVCFLKSNKNLIIIILFDKIKFKNIF